MSNVEDAEGRVTAAGRKLSALSSKSWENYPSGAERAIAINTAELSARMERLDAYEDFLALGGSPRASVQVIQEAIDREKNEIAHNKHNLDKHR